jgi:hypothetical protein
VHRLRQMSPYFENSDDEPDVVEWLGGTGR